MKFLHKKLDARRETGTLRSLKPFSHGVDFYSNDYLGMARYTPLAARAEEWLRHSGLADRNGSGGSRLLSGNFAFLEETETFLADFFGAETALVYHSGYDALLGTLSCLPGRGDTVLYDEWVHASARDGICLSWAKNHAFRHNDLHDLEAKLKKAEGNVFVIVESLYSMDGDYAPLAEMAVLQERYGFVWLIDEAHAGGLYGGAGKGLASAYASHPQVIRVVTFGKAYGVEGACVLGAAPLKEYLVNFSRPFIYTTAPAPGFFAKVRVAVETVTGADEARKSLEENIRFFGERFSPHMPCTGSPIQVFTCADTLRLRQLADKLSESGMAVRPIFSPTVPEGRERLRIVLHAYNTADEIRRLAEAIF